MSDKSSRVPLPEFEVIPLSPVRLAIAARVSQSAREIPQFSTRLTVDASRLVAARAKMKEEAAAGAVVPTFNDFFLLATARTLKEHPGLNAWLEDDCLKIAKSVNVAFVADTERGVLLPCIREADKKSLEEIVAERSDLVGLCRSGKIRASQQMGATFTVSNMGASGIDDFNAIISPPQVGILAIGSIKPRPHAVGDKVEIRETVTLTLTVDHRAVDGVKAAAFLSSLARRLEEWE